MVREEFHSADFSVGQIHIFALLVPGLDFVFGPRSSMGTS
jgi:hypothetical protein